MTTDLTARRAEFHALIRARLERVRGDMTADDFELLVADIGRTAEQFAAIEH